ERRGADRLVVEVRLLQRLEPRGTVLVRPRGVHVEGRVGRVEGRVGRRAAVDVLLVAQLVVVQQRVVPRRVEEVRQAGVGAGVDGEELLAVFAPVVGQGRGAVDRGRIVRRPRAAGGFVNGVAQPGEVVEVGGQDALRGRRREVGAGRGRVGANQAVGV